MTPLDDCCYRCVECGRVTCRDEAPSPREVVRICADCYDEGEVA